MIVTRWQAPLIPTKEQVKQIFLNEGLEPKEEMLDADKPVEDFRSPFSEVRMVVEGELLMTISGNQFLLRTGDKILIPSNTRQSKKASGNKPCSCIYAYTAT